MISQGTLTDLAPKWKNAYAKNSLHVPFLTWDWHNNWNTVFGTPYTPFFLSINDTVIAPMVRSGGKVMFSGGEEIADYLDIIGPDGNKESAWGEIIGFCKKTRVTSIALSNVPENSPTLRFFQKFDHVQITQEDTTPRVDLPDTWEQYVESLPSRKYRHELERKVRKFEREHIDAEIKQSANPAGDINILLRLMEKDNAKKIFLTGDMKTMFQKTAAVFQEDISLLLLKMRDNDASATLSFVSGGAYYLYNSGFDKSCCRNSGFYLKSMSIKHAIENGYKTYNFLQGSERYKYELGGKDFFVYTIEAHL